MRGDNIKWNCPAMPGVLRRLSEHGFVAEVEAIVRAKLTGADLRAACDAAMRAMATIPENEDYDTAEGCDILDTEGNHL